jgi:hypothetical protein
VVPLFLQKHSANEPTTILLQVSNYDPNDFSADDILDYCVLVLDIFLDDDKFTTCGVVSQGFLR